MADNKGIPKKESPVVEEAVSEIQEISEIQPIPEEGLEEIQTPEIEAQPEAPEETEEEQETMGEEGQQPAVEPAVTPTVAPSSVSQVEEDLLSKQINSILEEDLMDMYVSMPAEKQLEFKKKGEETASKIRIIVSKAHVNAKKIFHLIRGWLKIIPGVNRFFLEQEAKIKTDKILLVTDEEKKRH